MVYGASTCVFEIAGNFDALLLAALVSKGRCLATVAKNVGHVVPTRPDRPAACSC